MADSKPSKMSNSYMSDLFKNHFWLDILKKIEATKTMVTETPLLKSLLGGLSDNVSALIPCRRIV